MAARIVSIQRCPGHREQMEFLQQATVRTGLGIEGDNHARPASKRQVLLADLETLEELGLAPGTIKENVTVSGLDTGLLRAGQVLRLGRQVVLEVVGQCEPCFRMDEIRAGLRQELGGRRGALAWVRNGGLISVGDPVVIEEQALAV
jgi:MOSC domain-containing protein YiiM